LLRAVEGGRFYAIMRAAHFVSTLQSVAVILREVAESGKERHGFCNSASLRAE
jgi:hypothetical protein